ncbi:hypothetical protein VNO77_18832 [Canavalia gladiata]|uniref:Uncharacterized protein n=1 Tax=Canavalia gladiata TaxID=3824 RepID=A0AAN9LLF1_CANGL
MQEQYRFRLVEGIGKLTYVSFEPMSITISSLSILQMRLGHPVPHIPPIQWDGLPISIGPCCVTGHVVSLTLEWAARMTPNQGLVAINEIKAKPFQIRLVSERAYLWS